jgi:hypothetical protein
MVYRLGLSLRLTGRDMMRLGGTIDRALRPFLTGMEKALAGSLAWEAGLQDISWAFEDIGSIIGDMFAPVLEQIVDILEYFAQVIEENPLARFLVIVGIGILLFAKLAASLLTFVGSFTLYAGTLMIASRAHLGFGATLKAIIIGLTQGQEAMLQYIASLKGIGTEAEIAKTKLFSMWKALQEERARLLAEKKALEENAAAWAFYAQGAPDYQEKLKAYEAEIKRVNNALLKNEIRLETVGSRMEEFGITTVDASTGLKELQKPSKGVFSSLKSGAKTLVKVAAGGVLLGGVASFLIANWAPLGDLFQTIGETLIDLFEPFAPIIEGITQWIEENPELAKTILAIILAVSALIVIFPKLQGLITGITNAISGLIGKLTDFTGVGKQTSQTSAQMTFANAALLASVAALVAAIAYLFSVFGNLGVSLWEGVGAVAAMFAAILGFLVGLGQLSQMMGEVQGNIMMGVVAFGLLLGVFAAFLGILTLLLPPLLKATHGILGLVEVLFTLAGAMLVLALVAALIGTLAPLVILGAIAFGILSLALLAFGAAWIVAGIGLDMIVRSLGKLAEIAPTLPLIAVGLMGIAAGLLGIMVAGFGAFGAILLVTGSLFLLAASLLITVGPLMMVAAGLLLAGASLNIVNAGLAQMVSFAPVLPSIAEGLLSISLALAGIAMSGFGAAAAIMVLAAAMFLLAGALTALTIPLGVVAALGGQSAVLETLKHLPYFEEGGIVTRTGVAVVHKGEEIVPAKGAPASRAVYNTFYINATIREEADIEKLAREINRLQGTQIGRTR